ncbi:MAG: Rne/Rng family ribonuclease [Actinomycetaceae bacterium]|nr:Rne/Rng family ribonuclease [Actinomycetaceae bacterium]
MSTELNEDSAQGGEQNPAQQQKVGFGVPFFSGANESNSNEEESGKKAPVAAAATLLFQAPEIERPIPSRSDNSDDSREDRQSKSRESDRRRRRANAERESDYDESDESSRSAQSAESGEEPDEEIQTSRRRRRRRSRSEQSEPVEDYADEVTGVKGSTRLEAKRQRRREGRRENRRRQVVTESEFLARRESVKREMIVREKNGLNQIAVLEDGLLVEHYVARRTQQTMVGNIYLGRVQNVLPSMEAAFVDLGKGRNAVLYAGEVNWEAVGLSGRPRRIEQALKSGDTVLVQVTKDPIGHKGARLTSQITLAGRFLVLVPDGQMTGISRKLPEKERNRLKKLLSKIVPKDSGVIVRTAAEGATEKQLRDDVKRLQAQWDEVVAKQKKSQKAPVMLRSEPELAVRVVRDVFNEDFSSLTVQGNGTWDTIHDYVSKLSPDLKDRLHHWTKKEDVFKANRIDEQLTKGMDNKVWLPSGGSLIIDRTEAMTVVDVNTGKFVGSGGTLEETVTKNNLEAAEEIVRQLRLRDIGGIIVIDFVDMVLESNRDLVLRRLVECLGRDRTRHQVTEITALGLVQMTRKRVGEGLVEAFSTPCECCEGRGFIVHSEPVEKDKSGRAINTKKHSQEHQESKNEDESKPDPQREEVKAALSAIAASAASKHQESAEESDDKPAQEKRGSRRGRKSGGRSSSKKDEPQKQEPQKQDAQEQEPQKQDAQEQEPQKRDPQKHEEQESKSEKQRESASQQSADKATESRPVTRRRGRRTATMDAGKPQVKIELPEVANTGKITRPAAMSLDDIELPNPEDRPAKKSRRVVMTDPGAPSSDK